MLRPLLSAPLLLLLTAAALAAPAPAPVPAPVPAPAAAAQKGSADPYRAHSQAGEATGKGRGQPGLPDPSQSTWRKMRKTIMPDDQPGISCTRLPR